MDEDVEKVIDEIRARGEQLLDGFEDVMYADLAKVLPHLEELKHQQDDILCVLDSIKKGRKPK